jgi:hypothetical protein
MNCSKQDSKKACGGEVREYPSRTGITTSKRCEVHQEEHNEEMDKLEERLNHTYPGWNSDAAYVHPPDWFDPTYAGERWNEDD